MTPRFNDALLQVAGDALGIEEYPGARHNAAILKMFEDSGFDEVNADEVPWCAAFVNSVLAAVGLPGTGSLMARSFDSYGSPVPTNQVLPGDIVRIWTETPESPRGHVGFAVRAEGDKIILRGGNQGNKVSDAPYLISKIVAVRRADGVQTSSGRPILRRHDRGAFVTDLQDQLIELGYPVGRVDGHFGSRTHEAVMGFQADNGLIADGIVGPKTWEALTYAVKRPKRVVEMEDLEDSRTIKDAKRINATAGAVAGATGLGTVIEVTNAARQVADSESTIQAIGRILMENWWVLLVFGAMFLIWYFGRQIMQFRLDDARTGKHLGR